MSENEAKKDKAVDAIVQSAQRGIVPSGAVDTSRLLQAFYSNKSKATLATYKQCLKRFQDWLTVKTEAEALRQLLGSTGGEANLLVLKYRDYMVTQTLSPATVNLNIAALRSAVELAQMIGFVNWSLHVKSVKSETYRDTAGPGKDGFDNLLLEMRKYDESYPVRTARDRAMLWLLYSRALRRGEVCALDFIDFEPERKAVRVLRKGKLESELLTISEAARDAIIAWLKFRGDAPGPLFVAIRRGGKLRRGLVRLTGLQVWRIISKIGIRAGMKVWPHGLRHAGITEALNVSGGNLRAVQRFSGHKNVQMLMRYDDNREDLGGKLSDQIGQLSREPEPKPKAPPVLKAPKPPPEDSEPVTW